MEETDDPRPASVTCPEANAPGPRCPGTDAPSCADCQNIVSIDDWEDRKIRKLLAGRIVHDYEQLFGGMSELADLKTLDQNDLPTTATLRDHAEHLKFLADRADRCARHLGALIAMAQKPTEP